MESRISGPSTLAFPNSIWTVNSTLAVSNIRNRTYTDYEVYLIDYGYGNFKEKIHFME